MGLGLGFVEGVGCCWAQDHESCWWWWMEVDRWCCAGSVLIDRQTMELTVQDDNGRDNRNVFDATLINVIQ